MEDARNSLLAHYSSKSTNQTTMLLGLAVVFFAVVELYRVLELPIKWEGGVFLTFFLGGIVIIGVRAVGRLLYYGELATAILYVELAGKDETKLWMNTNVVPESFRSKVAPTYQARLCCSCAGYRDAYLKGNRVFALGYKVTHRNLLAVVCWTIALGVVVKLLFFG
jgi:hypothetical protein